ncbi:MAG: hypothetical protein AMXMBFR13_06640 [Phycisphaerae bacterium]
MTQMMDIAPVLKRLADGGRIEVKGSLSDKAGALTFRRVRVGNIDADTIRVMLGDGLLYCEPGQTQNHYGITQKGREALAALTRSH